MCFAWKWTLHIYCLLSRKAQHIVLRIIHLYHGYVHFQNVWKELVKVYFFLVSWTNYVCKWIVWAVEFCFRLRWAAVWVARGWCWEQTTSCHSLFGYWCRVGWSLLRSRQSTCGACCTLLCSLEKEVTTWPLSRLRSTSSRISARPNPA